MLMPRIKQTPRKDRSVYDSFYSGIDELKRRLSENSRSIVEGFFALFISIITAVSAGILLGKYQETLLLLPGLIIMIPPALGMRGNLYTSLGSRLGSALHMG